MLVAFVGYFWFVRSLKKAIKGQRGPLAAAGNPHDTLNIVIKDGVIEGVFLDGKAVSLERSVALG